MSKDKEREQDTQGATTIRASKGGGGGKWLLGAAAAAVLLGGGYFAWKTYAANDGTQSAYNDANSTDPYANDPLRAGPAESDQDALAEPASSDDSVTPPSSEARSTAQARRQAVRTQDVPEETIGITPINATSDEAMNGEDIVVTANRRPIWVRTPNQRRLSALYPERALERGREGEARLHCTVQGDGGLDCARVEETPGGFGPAAVRVARTLRHAPQLADGSDATGTPVNLRVVFRIPDDQQRRG